ncbi:hypothetical protein ACR3LR_01775 [Pantoea eucalypti]|uniref:hypothetical protein n=1 Tax=Pantoea eucalypti TaxID=470933 RepID=UPI003EE7D9F4
MEDGDLDCVVSSQLRHTSGIVSDPVITDRLNCIMRQNHPLSDAPLTLSEFLAPVICTLQRVLRMFALWTIYCQVSVSAERLPSRHRTG